MQIQKSQNLTETPIIASGSELNGNMPRFYNDISKYALKL